MLERQNPDVVELFEKRSSVGTPLGAYIRQTPGVFRLISKFEDFNQRLVLWRRSGVNVIQYFVGKESNLSHFAVVMIRIPAVGPSKFCFGIVHL